MKKLFTTMLVAVFLVSSLGFASAGSYSDVEGSKFETAVTTLTSLGLLQGFPDGTFRPDDTITRAQFAAVAVRCLGLEGAAEYAKGATRFPDVAATHWASGYVNIAVDQGVIKGYPDGTFKPGDPVTGAEVLAMLIRVLGYEPAIRGSWPTKYLVKAFEIGLSKGVTFSASAAASRGSVALFVENALEIPLMKATSVGDVSTYEISDDTLLDDKLGFIAITGVVEDTGDMFGSLLDTDEVRLGAEVLTVADGLNISDWLGLKIKGWYDAATDTLVVARVLTPASRIITGKVAASGKTATKVKVGSTWYTLDAPVIFWNMVDGGEPIVDADWIGANVTLVLNADGKVGFIIGTDFDGSLVLTEVSTRFDRIKGRPSDAGAEVTLRETNYDRAVIVKDGVAAELADLEVNDVVDYFTVTVGADDFLYIRAVDDKVAGDVEEVFVNASNAIVIVVDGEEYVCAAGTVSPDDNKTWASLTESSLVDYVGADVELYLNAEGKVRHVVGEVDVAPPALWGIVTSAPYDWGPVGDEEYFVKVRIVETGKIVRYQFLDAGTGAATWAVLQGANTGAASADWIHVAVGDVVQLELRADGMLKKVTEPAFDPVAQTLDAAGAVWKRDKTNNLLTEVGVKTYKLTSSTMVFDYDNNKILTVADFMGGTINPLGAGFDLRVASDGVTVTAVRVAGSNLSTATEDLVGVVLGRRVTTDGTMVKVLVEDEIYDLLASDATIVSMDGSNTGAVDALLTKIGVGDLVTFTYSGTKYTEITELAPEAVATKEVYYVYSYNAATGVLKVVADLEDELETPTTFLVTTGTVIYNCTGAPVLSDDADLFDDVKVQVFTDGDMVATFIKIAK